MLILCQSQGYPQARFLYFPVWLLKHCPKAPAEWLPPCSLPYEAFPRFLSKGLPRRICDSTPVPHRCFAPTPQWGQFHRTKRFCLHYDMHRRKSAPLPPALARYIHAFLSRSSLPTAKAFPYCHIGSSKSHRRRLPHNPYRTTKWFLFRDSTRSPKKRLEILRAFALPQMFFCLCSKAIFLSVLHYGTKSRPCSRQNCSPQIGFPWDISQKRIPQTEP